MSKIERELVRAIQKEVSRVTAHYRTRFEEQALELAEALEVRLRLEEEGEGSFRPNLLPPKQRLVSGPVKGIQLRDAEVGKALCNSYRHLIRERELIDAFDVLFEKGKFPLAGEVATPESEKTTGQVSWVAKKIREALSAHLDAERDLINDNKALKDEVDQLLRERDEARETNMNNVANYEEQIKDLEARVKGLAQAITDMILSADASWEEGHGGGHDWKEAVAEAREKVKS